MRIDDLLHKYFEGETTREEERELKRIFHEGNISEEYKVYRPLFAFFEEETKAHLPANNEIINEKASPSRKPSKLKHYMMYTFSGIAAGLLIILSITGINKQMNHPQNYIIIDGQKSADIRLAREQAQAAFNDVSFSREDIFESLFNE